MGRRIFVLFASCALIIGCGGADRGQIGPPKVLVVEVGTQNIPVYKDFVGQISGYQDIAIRARVEGFLEKIHFQEGSVVSKGTKLYTLESQPFEADVAAKMSMVAEARTRLAKSLNDLNRIKPLAEQNAVSKRDLDAAVAEYEASIASVEAAEANLRASKIQLSYATIHAPISGIIGKTLAKVGDFVGRSPNPLILNVVSRLDTILVQFFITENQYLALAREYSALPAEGGRNRKRAQLDLILSDGSIYDQKGKIDFVDRDVDPTTGAMLVQASFANPDQLIRPGQFAKIRVLVQNLEDGIMIPQRCVMELQGLHNVYVVDDSNSVNLQRITVGSTIGSNWLVLDGLKKGQRIIYEGLQKVRPGMNVNPEIKQPTTENK